MYSVKTALFVLFVLFLPSFCIAENSTEEKLKSIKLKVELQEKMLIQAQKEISALKIQLSDLDLRIDSSALREEGLREELKKIDDSIEEMNGQILVNKGKISILNQNFKARVRAIYKMKKGSSVFDYFMNSRSVIEILKKKRFLSEIAKTDKQLLNAVNEAVSALQDGISNLAKLRTRRQTTLDQLTLLLKDLELDRNAKEELISRKEKRKKLLNLALNDLRKSAQDLEQSLQGLIQQHSTKQDRFYLKAGSLIYPVVSVVDHGFGKRKHQEFSDFVFSKGIEFKTKIGQEIKAVANGKVLLARELPGYGLVVILDHGSRVYTLYARIKNLLPEVGDEVLSGQKIAETENHFYFELRKLGKAVDPMPFLAN